MKNKLFTIPKPNKSAKYRLFCFPYAGGSASTYAKWPNKFNDNVELVLIQPPGRGSRFNEVAHTSMESIVLELMESASYITSLPYVFFGHSLGSRVSFELLLKLQASNFPAPEYLIASGSRAPHVPRPGASSYNLPQHEFIEVLKSYGGTPKEIFEQPELMRTLLPLLRADFKISDTFQSKIISINCPLLVLGGDADNIVSTEQLKAWSEVSNGNIQIRLIKGDHFFIDSQQQLVIDNIQNLLSKIPFN